MTLWDSENFIYIKATGEVEFLPKRSMLNLPLRTIEFVMENLRNHTIISLGKLSPRELISRIKLLVVCGAASKNDSLFGLPTRVRQHLLKYILTGNEQTWREILAYSN